MKKVGLDQVTKESQWICVIRQEDTSHSPRRRKRQVITKRPSPAADSQKKRGVDEYTDRQKTREKSQRSPATQQRGFKLNGSSAHLHNQRQRITETSLTQRRDRRVRGVGRDSPSAPTVFWENSRGRTKGKKDPSLRDR